MCGIAGAVDLRGSREFERERLMAMTRALVHRGPDDEHFYSEAGVALGTRRLAIVDVSHGRQPMSNETGDIWVACNGELFDYPSLRQELLNAGHHLKTRCDSEAWVHLYEDNGVRMFERARGQFAVSLWDRRERTLILGRDRVGICPLYYTEVDGWLLWGSEIKALLASRLMRAEVDRKGIDYFFNFFSVNTRTSFAGIQALPPGHFLKVTSGQKTLHRYWDLDFPNMGEEHSLDHHGPLVDELENLLQKAVTRRLRGDVLVASYISGGLDSTVVLGTATRQNGAALSSFSIGLDRAGFDERAHASESAAALNSSLTVVTMDPEKIAAAYPELILAAEAPVLDTSAACLLRLAQAVHEKGFKVALTGEGADEALAGYVWFKAQMTMNRFGKLKPMASHFLRELFLRAVGGKRIRWPDYAPTAGLRVAQQPLYDILAQTREHLFSDSMWEQLNGYSAYEDLDLHSDRMSRWHPLNQSLYVGYKVMLAGMLLAAKGDRIAMNASVETRYPFLDEDVIEFCAKLDPKYKLRGMTDKWLLRQVAHKILPARIAQRPKTMFRAKLAGIFLGGNQPPWVDELLSPESLRATGYFDHERVAAARSWWSVFPFLTPKQLGLDLGLTSVIATQLWHHTFCGGGLCRLPAWAPPVINGRSAQQSRAG